MSPITTEDYSNEYETIRERHGISRRKYKSPGFCEKCNVFFGTKTDGHEPKDCRNPPFCDYHRMIGHSPIARCMRRCLHCMQWGHTMLFCRKIKECQLCGTSGHNPLSCWKYCTIKAWMERAEELQRCGECLAQFTTDAKRCTKCYTQRVYWKPTKCIERFFDKESQTEEGSSIDQESQTELKEAKAIIENQKRQKEEFNNKRLALENKLESSNTTIDSLNWKLQCIIKEKELELHKVNELDLLCKQKEMELRKVQEQINQKDFELEQHRKRNAQPSQTAPAQYPFGQSVLVVFSTLFLFAYTMNQVH